MLPTWIKYILINFSFYSFHFVQQPRFGGKILNSLIFFGHFCLCVWSSIISYTTLIQIQNRLDVIDMFNFFVFYLTSVSLYWTIIFKFYFNRKHLNVFWTIFIRIDCEFSSQIDLSKWNYLTISFLIFVENVMYFVIAVRMTTLFKFTSLLMMFINRNIFDQHVFFYILHLKVIAFQLRKLNMKLLQMNKFNRCKRKRLQNSKTIEFNEYKRIRNYYQQIYEMAECVNRIFDWSNLVLFIICFQHSVLNLYFVYHQLNRKYIKFNHRMGTFKIVDFQSML